MISMTITACLLLSSGYEFPEALKHDEFSFATAAYSPVMIQYFMYCGGVPEIMGRRRTRPDEESEFEETRGTFTTSYTVSAFASREGGGEVYVAGITDAGLDVVEKWAFRVPEGQWTMNASGSSVPGLAVGNSMPAFRKRLRIAGGGPYCSTNEFPEPVRTRVLTQQLGHVRLMVADPEGRFLLLLTHEAPAKLLRVDLLGSEPPLEILDGTRIHALKTAKGMGLVAHETEGRMLHLMDMPSMNVTLLKDPENDGTFATDPSWTFDRQEWLASPYSEDSKWDDLYSTDEIG